MLSSSEFSYIDSSLKLTETKDSSPRDCNLASPSSRSQSSVNKGVLNVKFVYNMYECFMSHELNVSANITC